MKKINFLKILEILIAVLTAGKTIHDEFKPEKKSIDLTEPSDNTDPQNPTYPPKK